MELKEVFEPVLNFIKNFQKKDKEAASKQAAKDRLKLVLMQDRASVSPDFFEMMKKEIIDVIKKYIEIDEESLEVELTRGMEVGLEGPALYANIPIKNVKPVAPKGKSEHSEEIPIMNEKQAEEVAEKLLNQAEEIISKVKKEDNKIINEEEKEILSGEKNNNESLSNEEKIEIEKINEAENSENKIEEQEYKENEEDKTNKEFEKTTVAQKVESASTAKKSSTKKTNTKKQTTKKATNKKVATAKNKTK